MADNTPAPKGSPRHVFGKQLTFYRERAGFSLDALGAEVSLSARTIQAYEEGRRVPPRPFVVKVETIAALGTGGALLALWDEYEDAMNYGTLPEWVQDWIEDIEPRARRLRWFEPNVVPGPLQTEGYMRAIFSTRYGTTDEEINEKVAGRLKRGLLLERDDPPAFGVILDEAVIRRPIGGRHVMLEQVNHLVEVARKSFLIIRIIPTKVGANEGLYGGGFAIADFESDKEPSVGYQEGSLRGGQPFKDRSDVAAMEAVWDTLKDEALPTGASSELLGETAKIWTSPE